MQTEIARKVDQIQEDFLKMSGLKPDSESNIELRNVIRKAVTESFFEGRRQGIKEQSELSKKYAQSSS